MLTIPSGLFSKYAEVADIMLSTSGFGVPCLLHYPDRLVATSGVPQIKQVKRLNIQDTSNTNGFVRGDDQFKMEPQTESITLRVYWTAKDFKKFSSMQYPDGSIMTIGAYADLQKINKCVALSINTDKTGNIEWKFQKQSEPTIHGLNNNYFMCFWKRV